MRSQAQRHASTALILLIALAALVPILTSAGNNRVETPRTTIEAPTAKLGYAGIDPTAVSLNWTRSTDSTFFEYTIRESFNISNGFETVANIQNRSTTSYYASGQVPEGNEWWQIIYRNQSKSQSSNPLEVTQPPVASLSYSMLGSTSIELAWNNKATYGGLISFNSYQLMGSISGRANSSVAVIRDVNTLSYKVIDLAPTSEYSFYLNTTDQCEGCSPPSLSSTISNIVNVNTPPLLAASANAYPSTIDAGQSLTITAVAANGSGGYTYSWANLPQGCRGEDIASITCTPSSSGTYEVTVTVTDSTGETTTASTTITIAPKRVLSQPLFREVAIILASLASATLATAIVGIWAFRRERSKNAGIHGLNSLPVYRPSQPRGRRL